MISGDDLLWYVDQALLGMLDVLDALGDERVNQRPDLPGANTPYAIVFHCCGVMAWWGGHVVAGRAVERDRPGEFHAAGTVDELRQRVLEVRRQLGDDVAGAAFGDPPRGTVVPEEADLPLYTSQGGALVHVVEELYQHLGQLELTRDVLLRS